MADSNDKHPALQRLAFTRRITTVQRILDVCPAVEDLQSLCYLVVGSCHWLTGSTMKSKAIYLTQRVESHVLWEELDRALALLEKGGKVDREGASA